VKLHDISVLSGARASAAETSANISVGCWVKAAVTMKLDDDEADEESEEKEEKPEEDENEAKIEVPAYSLGTVVLIQEKTSTLDGWIDVDFECIDRTLTVFKEDYGKISVLSPDHVSAGESGKISLRPEEELRKKTAQREDLVKLLVAPTQAAGVLDMQNSGGRTVLMYAALHGLGSVLELLVDAGAKPELKDTDGLTALMLACSKGHTMAAELLVAPTVAAGALDERNATRCTALMLAVEKGLFSVAERVVVAGAKVEVTDTGGMTALAVACVKLRNISVLSGGKANCAEIFANMAAGSRRPSN